MFPYILIYLFSFIFSICYSKSKDKSVSALFLILTFLTLFVPAAIRYNIGTDYKNYVRIITNNFRIHRYSEFEIGWMPILWFIDNFNVSIHYFFVFADFIGLVSLFCVLEKKSFWCCVPVYVSFAYIQSFSLVRQALAAAIFLNAIKECVKGKYLKSFFFCALSCCFHKSVIILCILLLLSGFKWKILTRRNCFLISILIFIFVKEINLAKIVMEKIVANTIYASYLTSSFSNAAESSGGLGILLREVIIFVAIISCDRKLWCHYQNNFINKAALDEQSRFYKMSVLFGLAGIAFFIMSTQIHIFNRLPNLIVPFLVLLTQCVYKSKFRYRKISLLFIEVGLFVSFLFYIKSSPSSAEGGLGIYPYQSIFSR